MQQPYGLLLSCACAMPRTQAAPASRAPFALCALKGMHYATLPLVLRYCRSKRARAAAPSPDFR